MHPCRGTTKNEKENDEGGRIMSVIDKIDEIIINEASATSRFKEMKAIRDDITFLYTELGNALDTSIGKRTTFTSEEEITFLEHYVVRALRNISSLEKKLQNFQKSLRSKLDFIKKGK